MTHRQLSRFKKAQRRQRVILFSGIGVILAVILVIVGGWFGGVYLPLHQTFITVYDTKFDAQFLIDTFAFYGQTQGANNLKTMANQIISSIEQDELLKQAGAKMGITVSDDDVKQFLESNGITNNSNAVIELARGYLLSSKIKDEHFTPLVPDTANQTWAKAMMAESESIAAMVRAKIISGENYTQIVDKYAIDAGSQEVHGDYGWHPLSILKSNFSATVPYDYLTRPDAKAGDISQPLADNTTYKKLGYWLIRVNSRPNTAAANVSAMLLSSEDEAVNIRAKLEAGAALGPIADNMSQYSASRVQHGELGIIDITDNVSTAFDRYVTGNNTILGAWSQPIRDNEEYTVGGYWIVQVAGMEQNRTLSSEDKDTLVTNLYSEWFSNLTTEADTHIVSSLTEDKLTWIILEAVSKMTVTSG